MLCGTVAGVNFATFVSDHPVGVTVSYGIIAVLLVLRSLASETDTANDRMFAVTMAISSYIPFRFALNVMCEFSRTSDMLGGLFLLLFTGPMMCGLLLLLCMGVAFLSASLYKHPVMALLLCLAGNGVVGWFFGNVLWR